MLMLVSIRYWLAVTEQGISTKNCQEVFTLPILGLNFKSDSVGHSAKPLEAGQFCAFAMYGRMVMVAWSTEASNGDAGTKWRQELVQCQERLRWILRFQPGVRSTLRYI